MLDGVAVDAGWLCEIETLGLEEFFLRVSLVTRLNDLQVPLLFDSDGRILAEYERVLPPRSVGRRFFALRMKTGLFEVRSAQLTRQRRRALEREQFDVADLPYLGVIEGTKCIYLTHEAKHLAPKRRKKLRTLGLLIADARECESALRD